MRSCGARSCLFLLLYVLTFIAAVILGVFTLVGSVSTNTLIKNVYLAELHTNNTYDIHFQVGYFGGCVSMLTSTLPSNAGNSSSSNNSMSYCVLNMRYKNDDDLKEEFWEKLNVTGSTRTELQDSLNQTVPITKHLQADVFTWDPPVLSYVFFIISSVILLFAMTHSARNPRFGLILLLVAVIFSSFALALALVATVGSLQAVNALVDGGTSTYAKDLGDGLFIERGNTQQVIQDLFVFFITLFYFIAGVKLVIKSLGPKSQYPRIPKQAMPEAGKVPT
ncbi:hypothetical protein M434DRAFT_400058 [Hypoxylon sp. CO27-5]|nr:hypothetical protein M434DRAFT_400058 [Hypoxylon sp. CO27-5]